jgi:hypothetical protein
MWKGAKDVGLSLPDPEDAAIIIRDWLLDGASALRNEPPACATCAACGR